MNNIDDLEVAEEKDKIQKAQKANWLKVKILCILHQR